MEDAQSWRELLATIIRDGKVKQRLIELLHITPVTLNRWINGESEPRPQNLRHLMNALPQYREQFRILLKEEKGLRMVDVVEIHNEAREIPSSFYEHVLNSRATSSNTRFWPTCQMVLQQALNQLDPTHLGMAISVVRCMPPSGPFHKVRSLRESVGLGTPPWPRTLDQNAMFLGAETLAGNVVTLGRYGIIQDVEKEPSLIPHTRAEFERSAAIFPILFAGRIAGVLLVSSHQKNYFLSQSINDLIQQYANLLALAFDANEFYAPEQIALCVMPRSELQQPYFSTFRQRVSDAMRQAAKDGKPITLAHADMLVWQQLEDELLKIPIIQGNE